MHSAKQRHFNKRNHEVYEIVVEEAEAAVVRLILQKYVYEGYGAQRVSRYLYENGMLNRKGVNFANTTIVKMIKNITYAGIPKSCETHAEVFPELQIIPVALWERAREIIASCTHELDAEIDTAKALVDDADKAAKDIKEQYDRILTWADIFEGSTLEGKKMIMWQVVEKVRIYRDYKFEVDLKPTVREFKELWRKRNAVSNDGAA